MSFSINGNGQVNSKSKWSFEYVQEPVNTEKTEQPVVVDNKVKGEYGDKLLEQVQPQFVQTSKIPETDKVELNTLYELAGLNGAKMPTVAQYTNITNMILAAEADIDKLTTTNNMEDYFNKSPEMVILDNLAEG